MTGRLARHRSGGPRPDITALPLDLSGLGKSRATRAIRFIEGLHVPKGKGARERLRLRPWQKAIVKKALGPGVRTAVVALPRGNGKSTLAAALALWALVDGPEGAEVPIVAGVSERQARIAFNTARRMVELEHALAERIQIFQDRLYMPHHDASLSPLPAEADALLGANPTMTIVDELGGGRPSPATRRDRHSHHAGERPDGDVGGVLGPPGQAAHSGISEGWGRVKWLL